MTWSYGNEIGVAFHKLVSFQPTESPVSIVEIRCCRTIQSLIDTCRYPQDYLYYFLFLMLIQSCLGWSALS